MIFPWHVLAYWPTSRSLHHLDISEDSSWRNRVMAGPRAGRATATVICTNWHIGKIDQASAKHRHVESHPNFNSKKHRLVRCHQKRWWEGWASLHNTWNTYICNVHFSNLPKSRWLLVLKDLAYVQVHHRSFCPWQRGTQMHSCHGRAPSDEQGSQN